MKHLLENWRQYLNEEEQDVVTFDFDDTLALSHWGEEEDDWVHDGVHQEFINKLIDHKRYGSKIYIVTSRHEEREGKALESPHQFSVKEFVDEYNLPVDGIFFTNGKLKVNKLLELGSSLHYDDDSDEIKAAGEAGIEAVISDPYGDYFPTLNLGKGKAQK